MVRARTLRMRFWQRELREEGRKCERIERARRDASSKGRGAGAGLAFTQYYYDQQCTL